MEIIQHFEINGYRFEIVLRSKSTDAHSLLTDYQGNLKIHVEGFASGLKQHPLPALVKIHREGK